MTRAIASTIDQGHVIEARFRVMGTDAHLIVVGGPAGCDVRARDRLDELEARWSRFRPESELCRLNAVGGAPTVVSATTYTLIERAQAAWRSTGGSFDPTVLPALERAGYDRDFDTVEPEGVASLLIGEPAPGCAAMVLDPLVRSVWLPRGVRLDLGGIGKGFAADLVASQLLDEGAQGACVNLGGDLRVAGTPPDGDAWVVAVEDAPLTLAIADGAVATTSRRRRVWRRGDDLRHHVIDPRTGAPAVTPWVSATVVAGWAVAAEPLAKATLLAPTEAVAEAQLLEHTSAGLLVDASGTSRLLAGVERFLGGGGPGVLDATLPTPSRGLEVAHVRSE